VSGIYEFDDFMLSPTHFELRRDKLPLPVQPKVLRTLLHLVEYRDRVVSGDELRRAIWPGECVGAGSIKRAVIGVRRALGEPGDGQHSVRTVRSFGYQFVRPVRVDAAAYAPAARSSAGELDALVARSVAQLSAEHAERLLHSLLGALAVRSRAADPNHVTFACVAQGTTANLAPART
jgi:DNA-binding winged helix-turn-helix (wHTH) protein